MFDSYNENVCHICSADPQDGRSLVTCVDCNKYLHYECSYTDQQMKECGIKNLKCEKCNTFELKVCRDITCSPSCAFMGGYAPGQVGYVQNGRWVPCSLCSHCRWQYTMMRSDSGDSSEEEEEEEEDKDNKMIEDDSDDSRSKRGVKGCSFQKKVFLNLALAEKGSNLRIPSIED